MGTVRKLLVMPEEYDKFIQEAARADGVDPSQIVRKALDLLIIARVNRKRGLKFGAASSDQELVVEITGIF